MPGEHLLVYFFRRDLALYRFPAAAIDTAPAVGEIKGPKGATGRLISVASVITVLTTVAVTVISVGNSGDPNAYADHTVPIGAAGINTNLFTRGVVEEIAADTDIEVTSNNGATAGDADILVLIEWYGGDAS